MYFVFSVENREGPVFGEKDFDHGYYVVGHAYFKEKLDEIVSGDAIVGFGEVVEKYVVLVIVV